MMGAAHQAARADQPLHFAPRVFLTQPINADNNWGIGEHVQVQGPSHSTIPGYRILYEVRRMPLPDLVITNLRQIQGSNGQTFICADVANVGQRPSDAFQMVVRADGAVLETIDMPALAEGQNTAACVLPALPAGEHPFSFRVDEARQIAEMNELDNLYESKFTFGAAASQNAVGTGGAGASPVDTQTGPGTSARPAGSRVADITRPPTVALTPPDLRVSAIEAVGRTPGRCVAGKHDILVTIKSSPAGGVDEFVVRVKLDDELIDTATIGGMASSSEEKVPMAPVELKPGKHTIQAIADPADKVAESDEKNNTRTIEVECAGR